MRVNAAKYERDKEKKRLLAERRAEEERIGENLCIHVHVCTSRSEIMANLIHYHVCLSVCMAVCLFI